MKLRIIIMILFAIFDAIFIYYVIKIDTELKTVKMPKDLFIQGMKYRL
jgi:hypothetical protein